MSTSPLAVPLRCYGVDVEPHRLVMIFPLKVMRHLPTSCEDVVGGRIAEGLINHSLRVSGKALGFVEFLHEIAKSKKLPKNFSFSSEEVLEFSSLEAEIGGLYHDAAKIILGQNRKNRKDLLGSTDLRDDKTARKPQRHFMDRHVSQEMIKAVFREVFFLDYKSFPKNTLAMIFAHHLNHHGEGIGDLPEFMSDAYKTLPAAVARLADAVDVMMCIDREYARCMTFEAVIRKLQKEDEEGIWPDGLIPLWVKYMKKQPQMFPELRPGVMTLPVIRQRLYGPVPEPSDFT